MTKKNNIEVCFSPALYPSYENPEANVIIVDILRATTSITNAFINGVEKIIPVSGREEALKMKKKGFIVAAPDVNNTGETKFKFRNPNPINYGSVLIGRSIVGVQAGDVVRIINYLKTREDVDKEKIGGLAIAEMTPTLLHAAAFDPSVNSIMLLKPLISYKSIVLNKYYEFPFTCCVAGALTSYDLPDLTGSISPRKVVLVEINDQLKHPASEELVNEEMAFPQKTYSLKNASGNLKILPNEKDMNSVIDWCFK